MALTLKGALPSASVFTVVLAPASGMSTVTDVPGWCVKHMNVAGEFGIAGLEPGTVGQMYVVIVDESRGDGDERDVTGEAAVIEPVDADGGNAIDEPSGVHGDDDEVGSGRGGRL